MEVYTDIHKKEFCHSFLYISKRLVQQRTYLRSVDSDCFLDGFIGMGSLFFVTVGCWLEEAAEVVRAERKYIWRKRCVHDQIYR